MFQCYYSECGNSYKTRFNLRRHINSSHLKIKSFICQECNKLFVSKQNLKEHHFIHTGEKPFPCDESGCCKRFRQVSQLSIHKKIHYRERIGKKTFQDFPRLLLSILCLKSEKVEEIEENSISNFKLPEFCFSKFSTEVKLPVLPCLLSIKKIN